MAMIRSLLSKGSIAAYRSSAQKAKKISKTRRFFMCNEIKILSIYHKIWHHSLQFLSVLDFFFNYYYFVRHFVSHSWKKETWFWFITHSCLAGKQGIKTTTKTNNQRKKNNNMEANNINIIFHIYIYKT